MTSGAKSWCHTASKLIKIEFTWKIDNFKRRGPETLLSSLFSSPDDEEKLQWRLELKPRGEESDSTNNDPSLHLSLRTQPKRDLKAKIVFAILDHNGRELRSSKQYCEHTFDALDDATGYTYFFKRSQLVLPNGHLTVRCRFTATTVDSEITGVGNMPQKLGTITIPESQLSQDMAKLLDKDKLCDVILIAKGQKLRAHKIILSARSEVFEKMFEHNMKERKNHEVEIVDVEPNILKEMLQYIYTDERPAHLDTLAKDILAAAGKYLLDRLKAMAEDSLLAKISVKNAAELLYLADLHSATQLKDRVTDFIAAHAIDVMKTEGWNILIKNGKAGLIGDIAARLASADVSMVTKQVQSRKRKHPTIWLT